MPDYATIAVGCSLAAILCIAVQFWIKRTLPIRQYNYFRDLLLLGIWMLLAIWFGSPYSRAVAAAAAVAGVVGLAGTLYHRRRWDLCFFLIGVLCALWGPSIHYIRFSDGDYIYLEPSASFVLTTLWFSAFPIVFRHLDEIPGLVGNVLAATYPLMLLAVLLMEGPASEAFFMTFAGLALLGAFWSRFGNAYRQAGRAMSSMWSILVAGTAILGSSKGIVFSSMFFLSMGLYAIPAIEVLLLWCGRAFSERPSGGGHLYRAMIARGLEHPDAVRLIAGLCALVSIAAALIQSPPRTMMRGCWGAVGLCVFAVAFSLFRRRVKGNAIAREAPELWGVPLDNVSMNYAISRSRGLISNPQGTGAQLVATVNALGMVEALKDEEYRGILRRSALVLADGTGLLWGMRFLGMPLQERVAGIDFAEQLCRTAAVEGWPVYFLGARGDTASRCAAALSARYPGLIVAGTRDGYFEMEDPNVPAAVAASGARVLLVAMGLPRQEKWVALHEKRLGKVLAVGVGGSFDVFAGELCRAPAWVQKIGMEWLYRLFQEPARWRKDLGLFSFVARVLAAKVRLYPTRSAPR